MRNSQRGRGWFGSLVILALAVGGGYYAYQQLVVGDEAPSCEALLNRCDVGCRATATENTAMQDCLKTCRRDKDVCDATR